MKIIAFSFLFIVCNFLRAHSQAYNQSPVSIIEIEKCLRDINFFRVTMLDNKFKYIGKIENGEEWQVSLENGENGYVDPSSSNAKMVLEMYGKTEWVQSPKIVFMRSIQQLNNKTQRSIFVQIRKDVLPKYKKDFEDIIKKMYPIKTVVPVIYSFGTKESKEDFKLQYSRTGSLVKVEMEDSPTDNWFLIYFRVEEIK